VRRLGSVSSGRPDQGKRTTEGLYGFPLAPIPEQSDAGIVEVESTVVLVGHHGLGHGDFDSGLFVQIIPENTYVAAGRPCTTRTWATNSSIQSTKN